MMSDSSESVIRSLLESGQAIRFQARGRSMAPFIRDGDTLTVEPVKPAALRLGAILFCVAPDGRFLCHRVLDLKKHGATLTALTRGDALTGPREVIPETAILGLVVARERNGKSTPLDTPSARLIGRLWTFSQTWRAKAGIRIGSWRNSLMDSTARKSKPPMDAKHADKKI